MGHVPQRHDYQHMVPRHHPGAGNSWYLRQRHGHRGSAGSQTAPKTPQRLHRQSSLCGPMRVGAHTILDCTFYTQKGGDNV